MAEILTSTEPVSLLIALMAGILPAIIWLMFWLREDRLHPEPRSLIVLAFLAGMLATSLAYPIEHFIADTVGGLGIAADHYTMLFLWSATEEILKYLAVIFIALRTPFFDEPIDAVIYFVTIGLGFAALENAMFLLNHVGNGDAAAAILLGNLRFIGSTVLHVAASGIIGLALAFTFYERKLERTLAGAAGLAGAIALHALFNFSIMASDGMEPAKAQQFIMQVFLGVWFVIICILYLCERAKRLAPRSHVEHPHTGIIRYTYP
jgi:RsiW-degrading membrane proteinase PrsW (M82 family)